MVELIEQIGRTGDSIGGVVECVARNVPKGLGIPVFDKLEADLAKGVRGFTHWEPYVIMQCCISLGPGRRLNNSDKYK